MDIGTAKPTRAEQLRVRHLMIDLAEPDEPYSAQRFRQEGLRVLQRIQAAGRVAFVVGGTGFYVRTLLDGLSLPAVPPNPSLRMRMRAEAAERGAPALHARLARMDPASAARIHQNNVPRLIRALEIVEHLNGPVPAPSTGETLPALRLGLTMERRELHGVADDRVIQQVRAGLVEETRLLLEMGYSPDLPALSGFGYRQMIGYLRGEVCLADAVRDYQAATQQYIRRQLTWFRADSRITWLESGLAARGRARDLVRNWLFTAPGAQ